MFVTTHYFVILDNCTESEPVSNKFSLLISCKEY